MQQAEFDSFAKTYDKELEKSLAVTGESREYYAQKRIDWTVRRLGQLASSVRTILDYGCGDGTNAPMLSAAFGAKVLGVDISEASIAQARQNYKAASLSFVSTVEWTPDGATDFAFTNGVFHHIPPSDRKGCLSAILRALRPGGRFAFWENNPWNLGTRYVMSNCAFDKNAIMISPREARFLLSEAGFQILCVDSLFYFPNTLRFLRPAERWLHGLPLGGQYLVLVQSPLR